MLGTVPTESNPATIGGPGTATAPAPEPSAPAGRRGVRMDTVVGLGLALIGLRIGLLPLNDNSFFTHLATGRLILDTGSIPRTDPYSFTALGEPWIVQSWGASVIYAGVEDLVGLLGLRLLLAAMTTALAVLAWKLTEPAQLVGRLVIGALVLGVGSTFWVERPLIFGLLFLLAALFAAEGRLDPRWLVPIFWLWVNIHGSFPLGVGLLVLVLVGRWLDRGDASVELRCVGWAALGTALGALNPLGPRLLLFPLELLERREAFAEIVEWQPPAWNRPAQWVFAAQLVLAVVIVLTRNRTWRAALPTVVFGLAAVTSMRNIPPASLVLIPAMAVGLQGLGSIDGARRSRVLRPVTGLLVALGALLVVGAATEPDVQLDGYPVEAVAWMRDEGLLDVSDRVVTRDYVGNYLEVKYGPDDVRVFIDDRVDMYPSAVFFDYTSLLDEGTDYQAVLERAGATAVLWDDDNDLGRWLLRSSRWDVVHQEDGWLVAVPST